MIEEARAKQIVGTPEIADALRKYKFVTGQLFNTDVSDDYTFQEDYCKIYLPGNAYSEKFLIEFFRYLEAMKKESNISFREAFEELKAIEGKNEMVAASVMVHTINPRFAIWCLRKLAGRHDDGARLRQPIPQRGDPEPDQGRLHHLGRASGHSK